MDERIPLVDLAWQQNVVSEEVEQGWHEILARGDFIGGAAVGEFERAFADFSGLPHCVGVANGTDALEIGLRALGIGPGSTVALPANTFVATAFAAVRCGAGIRLVDVDEDTLLIDPAGLGEIRFDAVMPVHLFGQLAPMTDVLRVADGRPVLEDAAQCQGASQGGRPAGSFGAVAATSFYPGKNLGAYGDAGAVLCRDGDLAMTMRRMANHGSERRYEHLSVGFNSRLDTLQAVVLHAKLRRLGEWNELRREAARKYVDLLVDLPEVRMLSVAPGNQPVWHLFPVRLPGRDQVVDAMRAAGVEVSIHYPVPLHLQPAFAQLGHVSGDFPVSERAAETMLSLPIYPGITIEQQERVVHVLRAAMRQGARR